MAAKPSILNAFLGQGDMRGITHPLLPGEEVDIYRLEFTAPPVVEARRATIVSPILGVADAYLVRFEGEHELRPRLAHSGWSSNHQLFSALNQHWRVTQKPELLSGSESGVKPGDVYDAAASLFGDRKRHGKVRRLIRRGRLRLDRIGAVTPDKGT